MSASALARACVGPSDPLPHAGTSWPWTFALSARPQTHVSAPQARWRHVSVSYEGDLVDRDRLAASLSVAESTDTALLIARAYGEWGMDVLDHLRGAFALAIEDAVQRRTFFARDHAGLQPVFYARHGDLVKVASSPKALVALPSVSRALNRVALADALCHRYPDPGETFYQAVRRLPSGCLALVAGGNVTVQRYWDPFPASGQRNTAEDGEEEAFTVLQEQAVARCLPMGRAGIFLSGGLDSVTIASTATDVLRHRGAPPLLALSLAFPGAEDDERPTQIAVAQALQLPHHLTEFSTAVGPGGLFEQSLALNRHLSSPLLNLWAPPYMALVRVARARQVSTLLTGSGGDEWMSASLYETADLLRRGRVVDAVRFTREWKRSEEGQRLLWQGGLRPLAGGLLSCVAPAAWDRRRARRLASNDLACVAPDPSLRAEQLARAHEALGPANPRRGFAWAESRQSLTHLVAQQEMEEQHELGQVGGVRFRHPYLDPDLVTFLCRTPLRVLNAGGWLKGLIRRQAASRFPALGFDRQRKVLAGGFDHSSLLQEWRALDPARVAFPALSALGVVDGMAARRFALEAPSDASHARQIWDLMNVESWVREQTPDQCTYA